MSLSSSGSSSRLARINIPRMVLWLASVLVAVAGYLLVTHSNTSQAAIYAAGTADYPKLFEAQSGSTVGGLLIAVGVLGALLALASMAVSWRPAVAAEFPAPATEAHDFDEEDDLSLDADEDADAVRAEPSQSSTR